MISLTCRDLGLDCEFRAEGNESADVLAKTLAHAIENHTEFLAGLRENMNEDEIRAMFLEQLRGSESIDSTF